MLRAPLTHRLWPQLEVRRTHIQEVQTCKPVILNENNERFFCCWPSTGAVRQADGLWWQAEFLTKARKVKLMLKTERIRKRNMRNANEVKLKELRVKNSSGMKWSKVCSRMNQEAKCNKTVIKAFLEREEPKGSFFGGGVEFWKGRCKRVRISEPGSWMFSDVCSFACCFGRLHNPDG